MRSLILCVALTLSGVAMADELADANQALAAKAYPRAMQLYDKLASAGNSEAQVRLGEMYWYGEGVAVDRARGDALFARSAAAGNKEAVANLGLSAKRARLANEITYWTRSYDGADLTAGKYNCAAPVIPEVSKTNAEIKATNEKVATWRACHEAFVAHMNAALPPGKAIPADAAIVMSESETQQAKAHLDKVYTAVMSQAKANALAILARRDKWETDTLAHAAVINTSTAQLQQLFVEKERERLNAAPMPSVRVSVGK